MKINIAELKNNSFIEGELLIEQVSLSTASNGKNYLDITLVDGQSNIKCKKWDHAGTIPDIGDVLSIKAKVGKWNDVMQLVISSYTIIPPDKVKFEDYVMTSTYSEEDLKDIITQFVGIVQDTDYKALLAHIFNDFNNLIYTLPAALNRHHSYYRGLAEHMVGVTQKAIAMASVDTDMDLLVTGALLHDIGKVRTYTYNGCVIDMTDEGKLLDHIIIGTSILYDYCHEMQIPYTKYVLLQHLLASHHGQLEWGSPVKPKCKEAIILHFADNIDSKINASQQLDEKTPDNEVWSEWSKMFGGSLLVNKNGYKIDTNINIKHISEED